jgi:acyl carrier protein
MLGILEFNVRAGCQYMDRRLSRILANVFRVRDSDLTLDVTKDQISSWDSLRQMDLVVSLEAEYGVTLEIDDIVRMRSIGAIVEVLSKKGICFED